MFKQVLHYIGFLIFLWLLFLSSLIVSNKIHIQTILWNTNISINQHKLSNLDLWDFKLNTGSNYSFIIEERSDTEKEVWDWLSFLAIFITLLAAFFIYSSWKIDQDLRNITDIKDSIKKIEEQAKDETEFSIHLKYAVHYMLSKQYSKAIDALIVLRAEPYVIRESRNINTVSYFLAVSYYEDAIRDVDNVDIEKLAKAVQFINDAIEAADHPLKNEIIDKFSSLTNAE